MADRYDVRPLGSQVLIRKSVPDKKTPGGIIIPDNATQQQIEGVVLAVGPGPFEENQLRCEAPVKCGDRVLVGKMSGVLIRLNGEELLLCKAEQLLAVLVPVRDAVAELGA